MPHNSVKVTSETVSELSGFIERGDVPGYYNEVAKLGSDYGSLARDYGSDQFSVNSILSSISDFYSHIDAHVSKSTALFSREWGRNEFGDVRSSIRNDLAKEHLDFLSNNGRLPTTHEIEKMHEDVFTKHGVANSWIGSNPLLNWVVDFGMGREAGDHSFLAGTESNSERSQYTI